jgi:hypothetical protein
MSSYCEVFEHHELKNDMSASQSGVKNLLISLPKSGRVRELLINSKKTNISSVFEEMQERFLCICFSITHTHYPKSILSQNYKFTFISFKIDLNEYKKRSA